MLLGWLDSLRMNPIQRGTWVWLAENQRSRDNSVCAGLRQQRHGLTANPAVDYDLGASTRLTAEVQNGSNSLRSVGVKTLSFHPNFGAHHKEAIDNVKMEVLYRKRIAYFYNQTRVNAPGTDLL